jgi:group II intron reverse transcriptase/maturase
MRVRSAAEEMEERRLAKENLRQQNTLRTQGRKRVTRALERVREAARKERKKERLTALLHHVYNIDMLREAYFRLNRKAAAGIDDVTWRQYGEDRERKLLDLSERLKRGAYRPSAVRRVHIPKGDGGRRPLGITTIEDKIVQMAIVAVFNVIYEQEFVGFSYGFRPGRSQHDALDALCVGIERSNVAWVLDADIRGFFDAIDHEWLMKFIEHRIGDRRIARLVRRFLRAGVLEDGEWRSSEEGAPQGGCISPLLANVFLHYVFDLWAKEWRDRRCDGDMRIVRYADDFVVGFEKLGDANRFLEELRDRLAKFGLELHSDKTRLIRFGRYAALNCAERGEGRPATFNFLGFTHICSKSRNGMFRVERRTMVSRLRRKLAEVKTELRRRRLAPIERQGAYLRSVLEGHYRYYGVPLNWRALDRFCFEVTWLWRRSLSRRSHKARVTWERMKRIKRRLLPRPKICHPFPIERFNAKIQGKSPVR